MKDDQQEAFEKVLTSTLNRVIDFLRYAEAKNAALLTFASAWIIGSINLLINSSELAAQWRPTLIYALPLFCLAALTAILSFLPRIRLAGLHHDPEQSRSLLYFGDAARFSPAVYRERVNERYYPAEGQSATQRYLDDLAVQIAVNSQITVRKLGLFRAGSFAVLFAIAILTWPAWQALYHLVQSAVSVE